VKRILVALALTMTTAVHAQSARPRNDIVYEASITELQSAMSAGRLRSVDLVDAYIARINAYDHAGPALNAIIRLNPHARADAAVLDAERKAGKVRGPLHGIPVIVKDNYGTRDMITSAGTIALAGMRTPDDAFEVRKLREAGAVILGKSNMHEFASGITTISSIGGQTCNPYDPDRNPGGSSGGSGAAVAASFSAVAWGSDTCGSIRIPSAVQNLFGLRPTKGLTSITGIVPLSHTQDVAGPLARSVMDLAIALDATVGPDAADSATHVLDNQPTPRFVSTLDTTSLRGTRIGVFTEYFGTEADDQEATRIIRAALDKLKARGATLVDVAIHGLDSIAGRANVINFEFKYDLIDYLAKIPNAPVKSLGEALDDGLYDIALDQPLHARETNGTRDNESYRAAIARRAAARNMLVAFLDSAKLDAIVYPTVRRKAAYIGEPQRGANCQLSAITGLPALSMPAGFTPDGLPIGMELLGRPLSDARLVSFAYDYEQFTHPRRAPSTTPPLVGDHAPNPVAFTTNAKGGSANAVGTFTFDPTRRLLGYSVRVTGVPAASIYGISIDRLTDVKKGPVILVLGHPGVANATGHITLGEAERRDLVEGKLALVVYTVDEPHGTMRGAMTPPQVAR
jgi:amidase